VSSILEAMSSEILICAAMTGLLNFTLMVIYDVRSYRTKCNELKQELNEVKL
jgi:hypothetical protein